MAESAEVYEPCVVREGDDALKRLADFGLRVGHFDAAVKQGHDKASQVSRVHPRTYQGQVMWAETVAQLRTQLLNLDQGWDTGSTNNYETVFHPRHALAIAVIGGDANTGEKGFKHPKAARRRGPVTAKRVRRNAFGQQAFDLPEFKDSEDDELCELWSFLLNARNNSIHRELSMALTLGGDKRFEVWRERIILPPLPLTGVVVTPVDNDGDEPPQIHVGRK